MNATDRAADAAEVAVPHLHTEDNAAQSRFELYAGGDLIGILGYAVETADTPAPEAGAGTQVAFMHTVIMEEQWRRGLAAELVDFAFARARERGWRVRPVCTYVQRFVSKHRGYEDLLVRG